MLAAVVAALAWAGIVFIPGFALSTVLRPHAGIARNSSLAPLIGIGWTMAVAQLFDLLDVRIRPLTVLPVSLGVSVLACGVAMRRRPLYRRADHRPGSTARQCVAWWVLAAGMAGGVVTWCLSIPGTSAVLPSTDGAHHALYAHRILALGTIDPKVVLAGDIVTHTPTWRFYPLAIHVCAAMVSGVTGVAVNTSLTAGLVLSGAVVLPLGMYVLTRRLLPGDAITPAVAAALAATFAWFPYAPMLWGGLPLIVAMCQIPAALDAARGTGRDGRPARIGVLLALAGYGLFQEHNSELVAAGLFAFVLVVVDWRLLPARDRKRIWYAAACAAGLLVLLMLPIVGALTGGLGERRAYLGYQFATGGIGPAGWVLGVANPLVLLFAVPGLVFAIRHRTLRGWLYCLGALWVIYLAALSHASALDWLTAPWYSNPGRVSYMFAFFEVVFAALAVTRILPRVLGRLRQSNAVRPALAMGVPVTVLAMAFVALVMVESHALVALGYREGSKVTEDQRAGFDWLARHAPRDARVLNEFVDGSGWMETLSGVHPVFATDPETLPIVNPQTQWGDRWYLLNHAADLERDPRAQAAVRRWNVQYVYVAQEVIAHYTQRISPRKLAESGAFELVWERGGVTIFRIKTQLLPRA